MKKHKTYIKYGPMRVIMDPVIRSHLDIWVDARRKFLRTLNVRGSQADAESMLLFVSTTGQRIVSNELSRMMTNVFKKEELPIDFTLLADNELKINPTRVRKAHYYHVS